MTIRRTSLFLILLLLATLLCPAIGEETCYNP